MEMGAMFICDPSRNGSNDMIGHYERILQDLFNVSDKVIVAGSFPAYYYMLKKGMISNIPNDVDIDAYIVIGDLDSARREYERIKNDIPEEISLEYPRETKLYRTYGSHPYEIISQFDISIARMYIDSSMKVKYIVGEDPIRDIHNGTIRLIHFTNPIKEVHRIFKYIRRGWNIEQSDILKLFLAWENMNQERRYAIYEEVISKVGGL